MSLESKMAEIQFRWSPSEIEPFLGGGVERAVVRALSKGGGDGIRAVRAEGKRRVRARKRIRAEHLANRALPLSYPKSRKIDGMAWTMRVSGEPVPLGKYPARQTRRGVSVQVNKGQRKLLKGAFIATMDSGFRGVFMREGKRRLPLRHLLSSRASDVFQDEGLAQRVLLRGHTVFSGTFRRLLPIELEKAKR